MEHRHSIESNRNGTKIIEMVFVLRSMGIVIWPNVCLLFITNRESERDTHISTSLWIFYGLISMETMKANDMINTRLHRSSSCDKLWATIWTCWEKAPAKCISTANVVLTFKRTGCLGQSAKNKNINSPANFIRQIKSLAEQHQSKQCHFQLNNFISNKTKMRTVFVLSCSIFFFLLTHIDMNRRHFNHRTCCNCLFCIAEKLKLFLQDGK